MDIRPAGKRMCVIIYVSINMFNLKLKDNIEYESTHLASPLRKIGAVSQRSPYLVMRTGIHSFRPA